ncbi:MAG: o-succinylbenzoate--CoA ligase [Actinobacteria bacterium]|nr:o-succinylbenzoate--CoA ligase [Actinomycetota bacterium]
MAKKEIIFTVFEKSPQKPAIISEGRVLTFAQLLHSVIETGERLAANGMKRGDRIAILADTSVEYIILLLALWKSGVTAVPLSTRWPGAQVDEALQNINCKNLILSEKFSKEQFTYPSKILSLENLMQPNSIVRSFADSKFTVTADQTATIIFTSGSTGASKAAVHTIGNHYYSALGSNRNIPFVPGDRWLLSLPLYHVGGIAIIFRSLLSGGSIAIPNPQLSLQDNLTGLQVTHLSLVSTQLYRLLDNFLSTGFKFLKAILLGGSAIPGSLIKSSVKNDLPIFTSYGSTEMSSQITTTQPGDSVQHLYTSGKLLPYRRLQIAADGEILVSGETLFQGYMENGICKSASDGDNWFHSGDLGELDKDGYLHVIGRKDNMFISGGENIHPEEIERHLLQLDEIAAAIVVPVNDKEFGKRPAAFIQYRKKIKNSVLKKRLEKALPKFKIPDYFFEWPLTANKNLKPDRQSLQILADKIVDKK